VVSPGTKVDFPISLLFFAIQTIFVGLATLLSLHLYQPNHIPSRPISTMTDQTKYKLCYFVPPTSLQATKDAIFGTNLAGIFSSLTDVNKTLYTDVVSN
jgi:hypothetical protein